MQKQKSFLDRASAEAWIRGDQAEQSTVNRLPWHIMINGGGWRETAEYYQSLHQQAVAQIELLRRQYAELQAMRFDRWVRQYIGDEDFSMPTTVLRDPIAGKQRNSDRLCLLREAVRTHKRIRTRDLITLTGLSKGGSTQSLLTKLREDPSIHYEEPAWYSWKPAD
ncbi:MAG: hypothetical protein K2R93_12270 [Gemmatimonadaceae bacterium]|nr:hypothetical protein [Gemmatimonadaceae bacterium]